MSKWGFLQLGTVTGGASLLFAEALAGVISWSIPAVAVRHQPHVPGRLLRPRDRRRSGRCSPATGLVRLVENMIGVLRWGLWMSPIINSFLRPMAEPTWYNQDGAIRTLVAIVQDVTSSPADFRAWSLGVFISLLAYDAVRILIWLDHMGLRVATLVNLSFLGMDRAGRAGWRGSSRRRRRPRCIPEGVKRFTTWAPLLIPFYIPRGADWDFAWSRAETLQGRGRRRAARDVRRAADRRAGGDRGGRRRRRHDRLRDRSPPAGALRGAPAAGPHPWRTPSTR